MMDANARDRFALEEATHALEDLRQGLVDLQESIYALALRELTATRALAISRPALILETERHPQLEAALASAKLARIERERVAAENASSSGCCGC